MKKIINLVDRYIYLSKSEKKILENKLKIAKDKGKKKEAEEMIRNYLEDISYPQKGAIFGELAKLEENTS